MCIRDSHLHTHRIEKLLVVDEKGELAGLLTMKDIDKVQKYPNACKDSKGRLRVGAAIGVGPEGEKRAAALIAAGDVYKRQVWGRPSPCG